MKTLTRRQEEFILEQGRERDYDRKAAEEQRQDLEEMECKNE